MSTQKIISDNRDRSAVPESDGVSSVAVSDIDEIVEGILSSLRGDASGIDPELFGENKPLARFAGIARGELGVISPDAVRESHIPKARDELNAIVAETAAAADEIMTVAEQLEQLAESGDGQNLELLNDQAMKIYQACNFQDITGQRITKVVQILQNIETTVDSILAALGDEAAQQRLEALAQQKSDAGTNDEDAQLLNGPQLKGGGNNQDEIDNIFASFD